LGERMGRMKKEFKEYLANLPNISKYKDYLVIPNGKEIKIKCNNCNEKEKIVGFELIKKNDLVCSNCGSNEILIDSHSVEDFLNNLNDVNDNVETSDNESETSDSNNNDVETQENDNTTDIEKEKSKIDNFLRNKGIPLTTNYLVLKELYKKDKKLALAKCGEDFLIKSYILMKKFKNLDNEDIKLILEEIEHRDLLNKCEEYYKEYMGNKTIVVEKEIIPEKELEKEDVRYINESKEEEEYLKELEKIKKEKEQLEKEYGKKIKDLSEEELKEEIEEKLEEKPEIKSAFQQIMGGDISVKLTKWITTKDIQVLEMFIKLNEEDKQNLYADWELIVSLYLEESIDKIEELLKYMAIIGLILTHAQIIYRAWKEKSEKEKQQNVKKQSIEELKNVESEKVEMEKSTRKVK